jgi:hypothetical protein
MSLRIIGRSFLIVFLACSFLGMNARADILITSFNGWEDGKTLPANFGPVRYSDAGAFVGGLAAGGGEGSGGAAVGLDGNYYFASINLLGQGLEGQLERFDAHTGASHYVGFSSLWGNPSGVAADSNGIVYVSSHHTTGSLSVPSSVTGILSIVGSNFSDFIPQGQGGLTNPGELEIGPDGLLYVGDNGTIRRYDLSGNYKGTIGPTSQSGAFKFGPDGDLYVVQLSGAGGGIVRYNPASGTLIDTFIVASAVPASVNDIAFGFDNNLYLANAVTNSIDRFDGVTGTSLGTFIQPAPSMEVHPLRISFVELPEPMCLAWLAGLSLILIRRER